MIPAKFPNKLSLEESKQHALLSKENETLLSNIVRNIDENRSMIWEETNLTNRLVMYCHMALELWPKYILCFTFK